MRRTHNPSGSYPSAPPAPITSPIKRESSAAAFSFANTNGLPGWVLLPLRLFLGITFVYAGVQKLTDPQFFNRAAPGYIGRQIISFANGSPLHNVLMQIALPHAHLFGLLIACGEIAIGIGTLAGLLFRPAAFFGMVLSIIFFLTASWHVYPYFYGSDIVFTFCWLTLLLCGPLGTGLPALDSKLAAAFLEGVPAEQYTWLVPLLSLLLGVPRKEKPVSGETQAPAFRSNPATTRGVHQRRLSYAQRARETRRAFLLGLVSGGGSVLAVAAAGLLLRRLGTTHEGGTGVVHHADDDSNVAGALSSSPSTATASPPASGTTSASTGGTTIAQVAAVPKNSAVNFTIPSNGDPGVLVHLSNDQFVAYDATCTHAGCPVSYDQGSGLLICPCHGAEFDPAQNAAVVQGPAPTPLTPVTIHVDSATGAITL
ncbi:MAG TPA: TQO small subunit DoxD [Ktedonobacteraceae bacterium]|jgi:thiosulfate dehydrogenase [quinone] large subunit|nr:TQO small subunit DoxD [Ktedonobacteraceae bacterium]